MKTIFVTVGTTEFEELIQAMDQPDVYKLFRKYGYEKITFAIGRGKYIPKNNGDFPIMIETFIDDLNSRYKAADLIICHCGAGTMLDCLMLQKKILAVVNDTLMGNHQLELFDALSAQNLIKGITSVKLFSEKIGDILKEYSSEGFKQYQSPKTNLIDAIIQQTI